MGHKSFILKNGNEVINQEVDKDNRLIYVLNNGQKEYAENNPPLNRTNRSFRYLKRYLLNHIIESYFIDDNETIISDIEI